MASSTGSKQISNSNGAFGYSPEDDATRVSDGLAVGFEIMDRWLADNTAVATGSGTIRLAYFTAPWNYVTGTVRICAGGTAAATVTLSRIGLYLVDDATAALTLVASTTNDPTLFATANTMFTKAWTVPYTFIGGRRYAVGTITVATTAPTLQGRQPGGAFAAEFALAPRLASALSGQSDLVTPIAAASLTDVGGYPYVAFGT
jgi:hypothetical protein